MNESATLFAPLIGLFPFAAAKGNGSFITFSLTTTPKAPSEEGYIWIYMCDWRIFEAGVELAHSESSDSEIAAAVAELNGRKLEGLVLQIGRAS